jgi:hypothetical protein
MGFFSGLGGGAPFNMAAQYGNSLAQPLPQPQQQPRRGFFGHGFSTQAHSRSTPPRWNSSAGSMR